MKLEDLKDKKILILGYGKEGKDTYKALKTLFPKKKIAISDQNKIFQKGEKIFFDKDYLNNLNDFDVIIKTPGIPIEKVKTKKIVTTQTELFFDNFKGLIIGVTGTKGKGTVSSLIYHILKKAGLKVSLGGNIGRPVLEKLLKTKGDDIFVYELSSHQLQTLKQSPQIAVFLNLYPDHLDYYRNKEEYFKAKENIFKYQNVNDSLIYNSKLNLKTKAKKIAFDKINKSFETNLKGEFNQLNIKAAFCVAKLFNIKDSIIKEAIKEFKGLEHRLEYVGKYKGIDFYDDSMSTIPEVTIKALEALIETDTLIFGGSDKGSDYSLLERKIKNIKNIIILGKGTGDKIKREKIIVDSMKQAIELAFKVTKKVCLLSPGSASFNLFSDYKERGDLFKKWVKHYGKKTSNH